LRLLGNVNCGIGRCFANPDGMDFSPFVGSVLVGMGVSGLGDWLPQADFFGVRRGAHPTPGAIEKPGRPIGISPPPE
jgi:hypothetical protein